MRALRGLTIALLATLGLMGSFFALMGFGVPKGSELSGVGSFVFVLGIKQLGAAAVLGSFLLFTRRLTTARNWRLGMLVVVFIVSLSAVAHGVHILMRWNWSLLLM